MKYTRDTYLEYNVFCKTILLETKKIFDSNNIGKNIGTLLTIIATIIGASMATFISISLLAQGGLVAYFGSMGALIVANPIFAGIIIGMSSIGIGGIIGKIYKDRKILKIIKEIIVDRYKGDFDHLGNGISDKNNLSVKYINDIEKLIKKATVDLVDGLVDINQISLRDADIILKDISKNF